MKLYQKAQLSNEAIKLILIIVLILIVSGAFFMFVMGKWELIKQGLFS